MTVEWEPGNSVAGRYRLVRHLGKGGMGSVWEAEHLALQAPVALKFLHRSLASDEKARFMREARAAARLRSAHVVQILDYGVEGGAPFIAMELLRGETLGRRLLRVPRLTFAETGQILGEVARAVSMAHGRGIVHRDLKPDNIFIATEDDREIVKVLDFGIAKVARGPDSTRSPKTATGVLMGTPLYMSPEQARGDREIDWRADIWSFGVIAYECLVGQKPFESRGLGDLLVRICSAEIPVPSAAVTVPPTFDAWFGHCAHRDVERRFQSIREAAAALEAILLPLGDTRPSARHEPLEQTAPPEPNDPLPAASGPIDTQALLGTASPARTASRERRPRWVLLLGAAVLIGSLPLLMRGLSPGGAQRGFSAAEASLKLETPGSPSPSPLAPTRSPETPRLAELGGDAPDGAPSGSGLGQPLPKPRPPVLPKAAVDLRVSSASYSPPKSAGGGRVDPAHAEPAAPAEVRGGLPDATRDDDYKKQVVGF